MIYTLTANPALDRELRVPAILFGDVLRATATRVDPGGKGFNVSRALRGLNADSVAVGFVGGFAGQQIASGLRAAGIAVDFVEVEGETRTNVTVVADDRHIKVNEAGPIVSVADQQRLVEKVRALARPGDWWVISGSLPPGASLDLYADIVRFVNGAGALAVLDASGPPLVRGCGAAPFLVKPNSTEAGELTGLAVNDAADAVEAARRIHAMGVALVVISLGERGAVLSNGERAWLATPPSVVERNPIGAGDSMVAGLVQGLSLGLPIEDTLCWGVASGAGRCQSRRYGLRHTEPDRGAEARSGIDGPSRCRSHSRLRLTLSVRVLPIDGCLEPGPPAPWPVTSGTTPTARNTPSPTTRIHSSAWNVPLIVKAGCRGVPISVGDRVPQLQDAGREQVQDDHQREADVESPEADPDEALHACPRGIRGQRAKPEDDHRERQHAEHAEQRRMSVVRRQHRADLEVRHDREVDQEPQDPGADEVPDAHGHQEVDRPAVAVRQCSARTPRTDGFAGE